jgi:hypothetical protein
MKRTLSWTEANQHYLSAALDVVRSVLEQYSARTEGGDTGEGAVAAARQRLADAADALPAPAALDRLAACFGLSSFERDLVLLCAGVELDAASALTVARAQHDPMRTQPTFGLALAALPDAHWSALSPGSPLRHWQLIEIGPGSSLVASPLRIDERVLHYLAGVQHLDEHLAGFVQSAPPVEPAALTPSQHQLAGHVAAIWSNTGPDDDWPAVQLCGSDGASKQVIAAAAMAQLGLSLHTMPAHLLPTTPNDLETLMRLWAREAALGSRALLLDCEDVDPADVTREGVINRFIEGMGGVLLISGRGRRRARRRPLIAFDVASPPSHEQYALWEEALGASAVRLNGTVSRLVTHFDLSPTVIRATCRQALSQHAPGTAECLSSLLWEACRAQARPRLDELARRIEPVATWEDLVLPERQLETLRTLAIHVRRRGLVYDVWGFGAQSARGLGVSALFTGASGTGKTMAAEVLANELALDLYHIDLSQVVSKYIGETEKNRRRVFDAAEEAGAILLFDEADALFGKRSEVKDSHDRYANIEVSYLLQRMEAYRGLAILTTNMKSALDEAFLRRIRFVVSFPFPDAVQREAIWRRVFPARTPTEGLEPARLARLNVAGGNIRNIALHAAFLAAEAGEPVRMKHIAQAARVEYAKLEKPLTEVEVKGWV